MQDKSDRPDGRAPGAKGRLADAVREVKNRVADRDDVVVELREAGRTRLELLLVELAPVIEEIPAEADIFDFSVSAGLQPRLWVDAVAHVSLGRDRRTFRFLRDTRAGRVVLAESASMAPVAEAVTRYVAERLVERERALAGEWVAAGGGLRHVEDDATLESGRSAASGPAAGGLPGSGQGFGRALASGLAVIGLGALAGLAISLVLFWDRVIAALRVLAG